MFMYMNVHACVYSIEKGYILVYAMYMYLGSEMLGLGVPGSLDMEKGLSDLASKDLGPGGIG